MKLGLFFSSTRPIPIEDGLHGDRQVSMLRGVMRTFPTFVLLRLGTALSGVVLPLGPRLCMLRPRARSRADVRRATFSFSP